MIGDNIKRLRLERSMTQKNLADMLFISPQAISRWENNEVEPSLATIAKLAEIFNVSSDELLGTEFAYKPKPEIIVEKEYVYKEPPRQFLAVCEKCNEPIYNKEDIVRCLYDDSVMCKKCKEEGEKSERLRNIEKAKNRRTLSFILGPLATLVFFFAWLLIMGTNYLYIGIILSLCSFTFVSCLLFNNNFIFGFFLDIALHKIIEWPMLIFSFDLDGILWLIGMKILFGVLGFLIGFALFALAFVVCAVLSVFVYPFALNKNLKNPEKIEF